MILDITKKINSLDDSINHLNNNINFSNRQLQELEKNKIVIDYYIKDYYWEVIEESYSLEDIYDEDFNYWESDKEYYYDYYFDDPCEYYLDSIDILNKKILELQKN